GCQTALWVAHVSTFSQEKYARLSTLTTRTGPPRSPTIHPLKARALPAGRHQRHHIPRDSAPWLACGRTTSAIRVSVREIASSVNSHRVVATCGNDRLNGPVTPTNA